MRFRRRRRRELADVPWAPLRSRHPAAAEVLDWVLAPGSDEATQVDRARLLTAVELACRDPDGDEAVALAGELVDRGAAAAAHASGQRDLPAPRFAQHNLVHGQVRLGRTVANRQSAAGGDLDFGVDQDALRTSMLVVGPPGSGKTRGIALPVVEQLCLSSLTNQASVVVIDPKGDDFALPGWFDVTIDPTSPSNGLDLYGGTTDPDSAADRLAGALLPADTSVDLAYFVNAGRNALYACLAPFRLAFRRWPRTRELIALMRQEKGIIATVREALSGTSDQDYGNRLLNSRRDQLGRRTDPGQSMIELLMQLDRPALVELLDRPDKFAMAAINRPTRVRVAIPESHYPEASRILTRLVVAQFVHTASAPDTNRDIFKGLVIDEAGRFMDEYVARGVQKLRSNNAGLVLLTQTLGDIPINIRTTVFGSAGCKIVFGRISPDDARIFSDWFGEEWISDITLQQGRQHSVGVNQGITIGTGGLSWNRGESHTYGRSSGTSVRRIERARWTPSDLTSGIEPGHCVAALSRSTGEHTGPIYVDLRG